MFVFYVEGDIRDRGFFSCVLRKLVIRGYALVVLGRDDIFVNFIYVFKVILFLLL